MFFSLHYRLENLFKTYRVKIGNNVEIGKVFETNIEYPSSRPHIFYSVDTSNNVPVDLNDHYKYALNEIVVNIGISKSGYIQYSVAKNNNVIDGRFIEIMFVF